MRRLLERLRSKRLSLRSLLFNPTTVMTGTIVAVLALFAADTPILAAVELNWLDLRFRTRGPIPTTPSVVVAAIDERSVEVEGRWPWPRSKIAALLNALSRDGAKVIGFDITFAEPDENSRLALVDDLARTVDSLAITNPQLASFIRKSRLDADNDRALANALQGSSVPVVLGYFFHVNEQAIGYRLDPQEIDRRLVGIGASKYPVVMQEDPTGPPVPFIKAYAPQGNLDIFTEAAASSGYFSVVSDPDGNVRWMPLMIQGGEDLYPPLSLLCVWHYLDRPPLAVRVGRYGVDGVQLGEQFIPTDESGQLLINYRGPAKTFPHYSITDILHGKLPAGTFKDKIVLVGATAMGIGDLRSTPFAPVYPGPEIHATVIDNILAGDVIDRPRWSIIFDVIAIMVLGGLVGLALPRVRALGGLVFAATLAVLYVLTAYWLFVQMHVWLNVVYPLFAILGTYTMLTLYRYITEERERKKVKDTFKYYVSGEVIEDLLADPERLRLGGQERVLTVMFSDLVGFTTYSEHYPPSAVMAILSEYYGRMTEQVFANRGTLTNYIGDELMAIFGAPVEHPTHAQDACAAALAMREHRELLALEFAKIGRPPMRARTGINTGSMLVGNVGSKYRFAYTVLGDQVNLASRLEQLNRVYGTENMIGEHTADLIKDDFVLRDLDLVKVKGRGQALRIYELVGTPKTPLAPKQEQMLRLYSAALEAYRQQRWNEAAEMFKQCLVLWPDDGPARVMGERCGIYRGAPPPEGWDGAFEHLSKG